MIKGDEDTTSASSKVPDVLPVITRLTDNKLNGTNFFEWSKTIRLYLRSMGKASHLTSDPLPDDDLWLQNDARLFLQIMNSIEPSVSSMVSHCEYVKELMNYLDFLYSGQSNISRIYSVCKSFHRGEQEDRSLTAYVMEFKKMYEEFNSLLPLSTNVKDMQAQREQIAVISFLTGLRPEFEAIRSQFLNESKIPSLQETFSRVLRHEGTRSSQSIPTIDHNSALVSRGGSRGGFRGGHRGGFRGGHIDRSVASTTTDNVVECRYCHELGHTIRTCKKLLAKKGSSSSSAHIASTSDNTVTISKEEYARLTESVTPSKPTANFAESGKSSTCLLSSGSKWVIDSGASDHMTGNQSLFSEFSSHAHSTHVTIADGSTPRVLGSGTVTLSPDISLSSVLSLPNFSFNLLSVSKLTRDLNCCVSFYPDCCVFQDRSTKKIIGKGRNSDGLYIFEPSTPYSLASSTSPSPFEAHCRLGHPSLQNLKRLCPQFSHLSSLHCESCQFAKHQRVHLSPRVNKRVASPFALVHSDVWGPCPVTSKSGFKYFVTFVDDYSRVTWLYFMKNRSEVFSHFCAFVAEIKTQFNVSVQTLRSDNAKEYLSETFQSFMLQNGILHESSCVDNPAQNGVAERKNRHLLEVTRALLFQTTVPKAFWADAVSTACFLINRMPSVVLGGVIPYSVLFPTKPLFPIDPRIFGSTCFVRDTRPSLTKLDPKSLKCVFLGYSRLQKGYRCFSPTLQRYIISRDVTFEESVPYFSVPSISQQEIDDLLIYTIPTPSSPSADTSTQSVPSPQPIAPDRFGQVYERRPRETSDPVSIPSSSSSDPTELDLPIALRKGKRSCTYPVTSFISYANLSASSRSFVASLDSIRVPKTVGEALASSEWRVAMIEEMDALDNNGTWTLVDLPIGKRQLVANGFSL